MKTFAKLIAISAAAIALVGAVEAAPPGKEVFRKTKSAQKISSLKKGDRYVLVCRDCESASVREITDDAQAAELCHNGGKIHCDGCKKDVTIKRSGPPGKGLARSEVTYLNAKGEECMVLIPLKE